MKENSQLDPTPTEPEERGGRDFGGVCQPFSGSAHATTFPPSGSRSTPASKTLLTRKTLLSRRTLLKRATLLAGGAASAMTGVIAPAAVIAANSAPDRRLLLVNIHTADQLDTVFWSNGRYIDSSLRDINYLMRDHRANEVMHIDKRVLDFLYAIQTQLGAVREVQILSGYRSPETNALLAKRSNRVAKNSLHMVGKAMDMRVPGVKTRDIRELALVQRRGGVGYYPKSDFVHIDCGPVRHWG